MSLLANYEGLRHQIERLVRENEELKKLVRLIRENHELKSAIKTQAGGLGISGFSTGFGQMAATPQHQGNSSPTPCSRPARAPRSTASQPSSGPHPPRGWRPLQTVVQAQQLPGTRLTPNHTFLIENLAFPLGC